MFMNLLTFKRALAVVAASVLLLTFGCGQAAAEGKTASEETPEVIALDGDSSGEAATEETGTGVAYTGIYHVDQTTDESTSGSYASNTANENTVLVESMGELTMNSADINKTGDVEGDFSTGINAAVAVRSKGQMTLNESNITTNGTGAVGLAVLGEGTQLALNNTSVYTSGSSSPVIIVRDDASAVITAGILATEGEDSPCILFLGGRITLGGVSLSSASGDILRVLSGENFLTLDNTAISAKPILAEGSTLMMNLKNGASFTGELGATLPAKASVTLDATSKLVLTADTNLVALINADTTHQNIQSNGFSIYYDSNAPDNAYLENQSFALPGGGYLTPII